jgi:hypothetical protein
MKHPRSCGVNSRCLLMAAVVLLAGVPAASAQPEAPFPLLPGEAVATCASGSNPNGFVVVVLDLRDPVANAPGTDRNWPAPAFHAAGWTRAGFDGNELFGIALDDAPNPNVYLTSTSIYGFGNRGSGKVFRIDGTTGAISVFAELPNCDAFPDCPGTTHAGLGNVAYDPAHRQLFVTNFYDGKIYRLKLDAAGGLDPAGTATLDPFSPFDPAANVDGFAPLGERPWGVGVFAGRVYFGVWSQDERFGAPAAPNTVWSVALDAAGNFAGPAELEVTLPALPQGGTNPVADIAFSIEGRMLLAERTMAGDDRPSAHRSRVLEYEGGHGAWVPSGNTFRVGVFSGTNAAGGVDYVCAEGEARTEWVLATGDALHFSTRPPDMIYGVEIFPPTGGTNANAYLVDLDGNLTSPAKTVIGDVEALDRCVQAPRSPHLDLSLLTGVAADQTRLPRGSADPFWMVPLSPISFTLAVLVEDPPSAWPRFRASEWISRRAAGTAEGADFIRFERCFCLAEDAELAKINLRIWADDEASVFLNNNLIAGPGGAFRRNAPMSILYMENVGEGVLQPGNNCLAVQVRNTRGDLVGFDAVGRLWVDYGTCVEGEP